MLTIAGEDPQLTVPALAALVRTGKVYTAKSTPHTCTALPAGPESMMRSPDDTCKVPAAPRTHSLATRHASLLHPSQFSWLDNDADPEALACLPRYAPEIGALLRRPGLISDLHAAEPFAAVSLVLAVLQASFALRKAPHADELHMQALQHMQCAAVHCLK
jgi:hypothetical protein